MNSGNKYNDNFYGLYCTCKRPYPDPEDEVRNTKTVSNHILVVFMQNIVQRADPTLRNHRVHIAFGCHVLYKIITFISFSLNRRIHLYLKDR